MTTLSPTELFHDRRIFLIGSTGFLGKVTLSLLLHRFPNIGRVYVTVRARSQEESDARFWNSVITSPPFDPLRERYGSALAGFIRDKVAVLVREGKTQEQVVAAKPTADYDSKVQQPGTTGDRFIGQLYAELKK